MAVGAAALTQELEERLSDLYVACHQVQPEPCRQRRRGYLPGGAWDSPEVTGSTPATS